MVAKANAPIDTSSLEESIRVSEVNINDDGTISARLIAGGVDYSHRFMPRTGKVGNVVDYAMEQEIIHNFLAGSIPTIVDSLKEIN